MIPLDLNASLSGSSSATSGISQDFRGVFSGDLIVGSGAQKSSVGKWTLIAALAAAVIVAVVWLVRR